MLRIGLVGYGRIGRALVALLQRYPERFEIAWVADPTAAFVGTRYHGVLEALYYESGRTHVVVNAGPYDAARTAMYAAISTGHHYLDFTEDTSVTVHDVQLSAANVLVVPHCGLAPGAISIIGRHVWEVDPLPHKRTLYLSVGALPAEKPTSWWDHAITWSPEGLVHEHYAMCDVLEAGVVRQVPSLNFYRWIDRIDSNDDYESYTTSGGLGTLCQTMQQQEFAPEQIVYRSIRYRGHHEKMKGLIRGAKITEHEMVALVKRSMPVADRDKIIMMIETPSFVRTVVIHGTEIDGQKLSAIAYATASGAAVVLDLMEAGKLPRYKGLLLQEEISGKLFLESIFSEPYYSLFY